ncbi:hypothetical protein M422DRAFT_75835 [Sphaerobolus stellatus SS14]|uniref:ATP synthase subunit 5, mitochondrial n=1 Tax=Sphaerobolus stellatus (strain SS14) TaxID=990650 RepID=A0A0C9VNW6_SPHS4|nr:hypothetical protein M422DRAFT_75835 [Sphaerobolus stellatus SS14]
MLLPTASAAPQRSVSSIASKYSQAAYSAALAKSPQTLNKVQSELSAISNSIKGIPELAAFVSNPTLSKNERASGLEALYVSAEGQGAKKETISDITKNLFSVLSENGRLNETPDVIEGFNELVAKYKGEAEVTVTSAAPLDRSTLSKLESSLKQSQFGQNTKVLKIVNKVNPSILGGLIVDFGEKTIDLSVSSRVNKLNGLLTQGV